MAKKAGKSRIPTPKGKWQKYLERQIVWDLALAWVAGFGGIAAAIRAFARGTTWDSVAGVLYLIGVLGALVFAGGRFGIQWWKHEEKDSLHDLEGCLVVLHTQLIQALSAEQMQRGVRIRAAIHVPDGDEELVQATNYVGGDGPPAIGRRFDRNAGIIGLALRENKCIAASRKTENYLDYLNDLESNWGFSRDQARKRDPASMSWVAVPIGDPVDGILFADSTVQGFFDDSAVLQLVAGVAIALAKVLDLRDQV